MLQENLFENSKLTEKSPTYRNENKRLCSAVYGNHFYMEKKCLCYFVAG